MISATTVGRLGQDAELKYVGQNEVLELNIASNGFDGKEKTTTWVRASFWGKRAASVAQYCTKGTTVAVRGDLRVRSYTKKDGTSAHSVEMRVDDLELLGGGGEATAKPAARSGARPQAQANEDEFGF